MSNQAAAMTRKPNDDDRQRKLTGIAIIVVLVLTIALTVWMGFERQSYLMRMHAP